MKVLLGSFLTCKKPEREKLRGGVNTSVPNKRKSSGLTLPVFCQRPVGFLWLGLNLPAAMVTGSHGLWKKGKARLTLLFYSACHTSSLSGPGSGGERSHSKRGGHPHLVLAPLCRMEKGQRGWLFWKMVHAQSARVEDQVRLRRGLFPCPGLLIPLLSGQRSVVPSCREVSGSWEGQETRAGLAVYKNSLCSLCLRRRGQAPREPVRARSCPLLPAGPSP